MLPISSAAIAEKNRLCSDGVWAVMMEVILPTGAALRVCRNTEDLVWPRRAWAGGVAANLGSGWAGLPAAGHGLAAGDIVRIAGTVHYNGDYTLGAATTANRLAVAHAFSEETLPAADGYGCLWQAFPFDLDDMNDGGRGEIPAVSVRVGNVNGVVQAHLEAADGGVGAAVRIVVVHTRHLDQAAAEFEARFTCTGCSADAQWATFVLGAPNPFRMRFPRNRIMRDHCRWRFKGAECGYAGSETACDKSLARCLALGNPGRYGAFPAVGQGGFYA
jgi:lambda family phage minor tail protein L